MENFWVRRPGDCSHAAQKIKVNLTFFILNFLLSVPCFLYPAFTWLECLCTVSKSLLLIYRGIEEAAILHNISTGSSKTTPVFSLYIMHSIVVMAQLFQTPRSNQIYTKPFAYPRISTIKFSNREAFVNHLISLT